VSFKSIGLDEDLHAYLVAHSGRPDPLVAELVATTRAALPEVAGLQIAPEQAPFLEFLTRVLRARHAVEIGTFTGLSALAIARGLAPRGRLVCCDISEEYTGMARTFWERAGVADRIDLRIGPALDTLAAMPTEPHIDLAFIDADKTEYPSYWAELVPRLRPGGVIAVDNVFRGGRVVDPGDDRNAVVIAEFNEMVLADDRVESVMLPLGDGLTLARRPD
jgi:caffeoyl-CoA O-methyltransferase